MKKLLLITLLSFSGISLMAQTNLDSLYSIWQDESQSDSVRTDVFMDYIYGGFMYSDPDSAFVLSQTLLIFGEQQHYKKASAAAYLLMGIAKDIKSEYTKSMDYFQRSLQIFEETGDVNKIAVLNSIGYSYGNQENYTKALEYFHRCLRISEELGDPMSIAAAKGNIGIIYETQGNYTKALEYEKQSMAICEEFGNKESIANSLSSIGSIYFNQGNYSEALEHFQRSLKMNEELGYKSGCAYSLTDIGSIYLVQGDYSLALEYFQRSLKINEELGDQSSIQILNTKIGQTLQKQGHYTKALEHCNKALKISRQIGSLEGERNQCECLYNTYKAMGNSTEALVHLEKLNVINDSINAQETSKALQQMEFQNQIFADSMQRVEEQNLALYKAEQKIQAKKRKNRLQYSLVAMVVLLLAGIIAVMTKFSFKPKVASGLIFFFFILIFEFLLVIASPYIESITDGEVGYKISINTVLAIVIFGVHQISESRLKRLLIKE